MKNNYQGLGRCYQPQLSASADNTYLVDDDSGNHEKPYPIMVKKNKKFYSHDLNEITDRQWIQTSGCVSSIKSKSGFLNVEWMIHLDQIYLKSRFLGFMIRAFLFQSIRKKCIDPAVFAVKVQLRWFINTVKYNTFSNMPSIAFNMQKWLFMNGNGSLASVRMHVS